MYQSVVKRLAGHEGWALLGLFFGQYLMVVAGPALLVIGLGLWNPFFVLGGLIALRFLFWCCDLQKAITDLIEAEEKAANRSTATLQRRNP